jgi:hypothetical protein
VDLAAIDTYQDSKGLKVDILNKCFQPEYARCYYYMHASCESEYFKICQIWMFNSQFYTLFKKTFVAKMASLSSLFFLKRKDYSSNSIEKNER